MITAPIALVVTRHRVEARAGDTVVATANCPIEHCDESFWEAALLAAGHDGIDVLLAPPDTYPVRLPEHPSRVRDALADHAPLLPDRLVWTARQSDGEGMISVTVARRDRLAAIAAILAAQDLPTPRFLDPNGQPLDQGNHAAPPSRTRVTLAIVLAALVSIPVTTAIGTWIQRQAIPVSAPATAAPPSVAATPTLAAVLVRIGAALPEDVALVSVAHDRDRRVTLEIDTPDPDRLRESMREVPAMAALREEAQRRTGDARYRVTYVESGRSRATVVPATRPTPDARGLRQRLTRDAATAAVSLEMKPNAADSIEVVVVGPQPAVLAFAELVETRAPAARFGRWTVAADPAGVRLSAIAGPGQ